MTRPCLAAITLDAKGGGVAVVSRLLWRVFSDRWGDHSRLITLLEGSGPLESLDSSTATRLRFGTTLASGQAFGQCPWVFYSHLSVARVQSFVPPPFRRALREPGADHVVLTVLDQCLAAYPPVEWARLEEQLASLPAFSKPV